MMPPSRPSNALWGVLALGLVGSSGVADAKAMASPADFKGVTPVVTDSEVTLASPPQARQSFEGSCTLTPTTTRVVLSFGQGRAELNFQARPDGALTLRTHGQDPSILDPASPAQALALVAAALTQCAAVKPTFRKAANTFQPMAGGRGDVPRSGGADYGTAWSRVYEGPWSLREQSNGGLDFEVHDPTRTQFSGIKTDMLGLPFTYWREDGSLQEGGITCGATSEATGQFEFEINDAPTKTYLKVSLVVEGGRTNHLTIGALPNQSTFFPSSLGETLALVNLMLKKCRQAADDLALQLPVDFGARLDSLTWIIKKTSFPKEPTTIPEIPGVITRKYTPL